MNYLLLFFVILYFFVPTMVNGEWSTKGYNWDRGTGGTSGSGCSVRLEGGGFHPTPNSRKCKKYKKEQLEKEKRIEKQCDIKPNEENDYKNNSSVYIIQNKILPYTEPSVRSSENDYHFYPYGGEYKIGTIGYAGFEIIEERTINDKEWIRVCEFVKGGGKTWINLDGEEKNCVEGWRENCGWTDEKNEFILYSSFFTNKDYALDKKSLQENLHRLKNFFERDLITKEEYDQKRKEFLDEF